MNSKLITTFMALARSRNVSLAACELNQAQSTVSKRLRLLEEEVGYPLFSRKKGAKSMSLTPEGEAFVDIAERWVALNEDLAGFGSSIRHGQLRIGATDSLNATFLREVYHGIAASGPDVSLTVRVYFFREMYAAVAERQVEAAFSFYEHSHASVAVRELYSEPMVLLRRAETAGWFEEAVNPASLDVSQEVRIPWSDSQTTWRKTWLESGGQARMTVYPVSLVTEFLDIPGRWSIVPQSFAMDAAGRLPFEIHPLCPEPPRHSCYYLTHKNPTTMATRWTTFLEGLLDPVLDSVFGKSRDGHSERLHRLQARLGSGANPTKSGPRVPNLLSLS